MRVTVTVYLMLLVVVLLLGMLGETVLHVALRDAVVGRSSGAAAGSWPLPSR